jgi:cell wall-associated NlpC family hydrolase
LNRPDRIQPPRPFAAALVVACLTAGLAAADGVREAVVLRTVENMYSGPKADDDVVSQATLGQIVRVLERGDGFLKIETPDGYQGWIPAAALVEYPDASTPRYASRGALAEVTSLVANLYRETSVTSARPKTQATLGTQLELLPDAAEEGWRVVRLPDGESAYIQQGDIRLTDAAVKRPRGSGPELVATARRFLGLPYLWGGMTPLGVDCSGFVSRVYLVHGVVLPRDADLQFEDKEARVIEKKALKPGDLLFFGKKKVTHVGMYIGGGRFIHATTHKTPVVQESALSEPYWTGLFLGARRRP